MSGILRFPEGFRETALVADASLCLVCTGKVAVVKEDSNGCWKVLATASAGNILGEMPLIYGEPRSASVIALLSRSSSSLCR